MNIFSTLNNSYGQFDRNVLGGLLPGGAERTNTVKKFMAAPEAVMITAGEAVPAIASGFAGINRTDRSINPKLKEAIKSTAERKKSEGSNVVNYADYDSTTPGGLAARLTTGLMGIDEFKFNNKGEATNFTQKFDTNKTPQQALSEFNIFNPKTYYKPAEALLAQSQKSGITTHDVDLTGSKPKPSVVKPGPRMAAESDITVNNTAQPGPSMNYAVKAGDTLSAIAAANNTTVDAIAKRNGILNPNMINVGQNLRF